MRQREPQGRVESEMEGKREKQDCIFEIQSFRNIERCSRKNES